jgi:hypothetical protein
MVFRIITVQRRVDADELDAASVAEPVEQPRPDRGPILAVPEPFADVEVVLHLRAVVASLGVGGVVIADGREHRDPGDHVAVGLEEAGVPVVVLSPALVVDLPLLALVDVVPERQHEADVSFLGEVLQRLGDPPLPSARLTVGADPDSVVADRDEPGSLRFDVGTGPGSEP